MVDVKIEESDAQGMSVDLPVCMGLIEKAVAAGHDRRLLRWRVSPAQCFAMNWWKMGCSTDNRSLMGDFDSGAAYESGTFAGIPFAVDRTLPADRIVLDLLAPTAINSIYGFSLPRGYSA